jgi:uncharacterized membrane protein YsdA (DUF1294 family)
MAEDNERADYTDKNVPRSRLLMWSMALGGAGGLIAMWLLGW